MITFTERQQKIIDALNATRSARWLENGNGTITCSHCHTWFYKNDRHSYMRYCPYCNIKMVESEAEE